MEHGHEGQSHMGAQTMRKNYLMLGLNMVISTIIMYLVMFEMGGLLNDLGTIS